MKGRIELPARDPPAALDLLQVVLVDAGAVARVLGVRVAHAVAGQHAAIEEFSLRCAAEREHRQEAEVILRDLADARVGGGEDADHFGHRHGRGIEAAVLFRHGDGEQAGLLQRGDGLARQSALAVAVDRALPDLCRETPRLGNGVFVGCDASGAGFDAVVGQGSVLRHGKFRKGEGRKRGGRGGALMEVQRAAHLALGARA
jgi:hypothetical protein